eukprot:CAMPEP_0113908898 /NCGR_PEP_ID=MMETSP0780_2-20120614/26476_1 /TAXON_ID=652834 /ORGANISM="Palpitomonas bilix" /LENGTH=182 /DNA_ID=CAMNT_0000904495 /DNA_START=42 /DNA_END=586 /DNA_ORIENTATION=- /assembly_acc=CAM_ASM_000599
MASVSYAEERGDRGGRVRASAPSPSLSRKDSFWSVTSLKRVGTFSRLETFRGRKFMVVTSNAFLFVTAFSILGCLVLVGALLAVWAISAPSLIGTAYYMRDMNTTVTQLRVGFTMARQNIDFIVSTLNKIDPALKSVSTLSEKLVKGQTNVTSLCSYTIDGLLINVKTTQLLAMNYYSLCEA